MKATEQIGRAIGGIILVCLAVALAAPLVKLVLIIADAIPVWGAVSLLIGVGILLGLLSRER